MCDELRADGALFAMLGAFKESFYARYGWATFYETRAFSAPPAVLGHFRRRQAGRWSPVGAEAIPELDAIYRGALRARFGPLARDAEWWRERVLDTYSYLWRDDAGAPRAYALFHFEKQADEYDLHTREVVALDPQARAQIFALLASFEDQAKTVHFSAPSDAPVQLLMPERLECRMEPGYMLRVLDADRALAALSYPGDAQGRLTLRVADDWMPHNQGVFELEVAAGRAECRRLPDDAPADVDVDVRQLSQLISRHLRPRTAAAFGLIESRSRPALALLDRMLAGPAPFCSDWF
jgi:predicted acetyltransferase